MELKIRFFENEQKFDDYLGDRDFDSCSFSAETAPSPMGYHACALTGSKVDIDAIEHWIQEYASGCWLTYRYEVNKSKDTICVEFP